jgi:hypothetical protein
LAPGHGLLKFRRGYSPVTAGVIHSAPPSPGSVIADESWRVTDDEGAVVGYIYNVIPGTHPDPSGMTRWLTARGFAAGPGDLRRRVPARSV